MDLKYEITYKKRLNQEDYLIEIKAPLIASKFKPGQFIILRIHGKGERIPLTVTDCDPEKGLIRTIFKTVGKTTFELARLNEHEYIKDVIGPLGNPSEINKFGKVICVGGGTGIACLYPIAKALKKEDNYIISILGAKTKDLLIWQDEMRKISDDLIITTDDGSYGLKGVVTDPLKEIIKTEKIDRVIAIGPAIMMKFVAQTTKPYKIKTIVSLNTIMVDGTGMCGACRVFINGQMKFTCIDGPEFDAHQVNFDDVINRLNMFKEKEKEAMNGYVKR